jgi:hypothetical protein
MKLFSIGLGKLVDAYAKEAAHDLIRLCPLPAEFSKKNKLVFEQKVDHTLVEVFVRVKSFRKEHRLGIFKRARFAKIFQDELTLLGYDPELVSKVTAALVATALAGD